MPRYGKIAEKLGASLSKKGIKRGSHLISFLFDTLSKNDGVVITKDELIENKIINNSNFKTFKEFKLFMALNKYLVIEDETEDDATFSFGPTLRKHVIVNKDKQLKTESDEIKEDNKLNNQNIENSTDEIKNLVREHYNTLYGKTFEQINHFFNKKVKDVEDFSKDFVCREISKQNEQINELKLQIYLLYKELGISTSEISAVDYKNNTMENGVMQ
jgi:hypothetical protein